MQCAAIRYISNTGECCCSVLPLDISPTEESAHAVCCHYIHFNTGECTCSVLSLDISPTQESARAVSCHQIYLQHRRVLMQCVVIKNNTDSSGCHQIYHKYRRVLKYHCRTMAFPFQSVLVFSPFETQFRLIPVPTMHCFGKITGSTPNATL